MNATHRCLAVPELVSAIALACLEYRVRPGRHDQPADTATVAALARTCRGLLYESLAVLWRIQYGMGNLVQCLPCHLWRNIPSYPIAETDTPMPLVQLVADPVGSDWERFDMYARHVRVLVLGQAEGHVYRPAVGELYRDLAMLREPRYLLPALRELSWHPQVGVEFHHIRTFTKPSLTCLSLTLELGANADSFFADLPRTCPELQVLGLVLGSQGIASLVEHNALPRLRALKKLLVVGTDRANIPEAVLRHAAQLPNLQLLAIRGNMFQHSETQTPSTEDYFLTFGALQELSLAAIQSAPNDWFHTLRPFSFPVTASIHLETHGHTQSVTDLVSSLSSHASPLELRTLDICEYLPLFHPVDNSSGNLGYEHLQPLEIFKNLTKLECSVLRGIAWDDGTLTRFVSAFPHLRWLNLAQNWRHRSPGLSKRPTLAALATIVKLCPDLHDIFLSVDATTAPRDDVVANTHVVQLRLFHSIRPQGQEDDGVARFLCALFPNLVQVVCGDGSRKWASVQVKINQHRTGRVYH